MLGRWRHCIFHTVVPANFPLDLWAENRPGIFRDLSHVIVTSVFAVNYSKTPHALFPSDTGPVRPNGWKVKVGVQLGVRVAFSVVSDLFWSPINSWLFIYFIAWVFLETFWTNTISWTRWKYPPRRHNCIRAGSLRQVYNLHGLYMWGGNQFT